MERSQSCSSFVASNNKNNKNNNNNNSNNKQTSNINNISNNNNTKSLHLLQGFTTHQIHLQQQQQQQQQQFQHSGSSDSLNIVTTKTISASSASITLPRYSSRRKNKLQRQASTSIHDNDEFLDETAYHADMEEDDHAADDPSQDTFSMHLYQKHMHFAQHKPQSDSMIITTTPRERHLQHEDSFDSTATMDHSPASQRRQRFAFLARDNSVHSDSSRYSSVDSLLEARKPDPEAILINLGFGPVGSEDILSRIPKRFLKPSQVRGIDTSAFVKRLQMASNLADHSVLGYRGLTGNPDVPPSSIVAKIMQRFEVNQRKKSMGGIE